MEPGSASGSAELSSERLPTFENCGHCASSVVPNRAAASEQETLPSAAPGLIEKPSGKVTLTALICELEGAFGLSGWGTSRLVSTPEGESASLVEGEADSDGSKPSRSQPSISGHGAVFVNSIRSNARLWKVLESGPAQVVGPERNAASGLFEATGALFDGSQPPFSNRFSSFAGDAGTPHNHWLKLRSVNSCEMPVTLALSPKSPPVRALRTV